ncbi:MAG: cell division protein ZapE [Pseudomonadota bacterium]
MASLKLTYETMVREGALEPDAAQAMAVGRLHALSEALATWTPRGDGFWSRFAKSEPAPPGLYIWGGVGGGKTDLFFNHAPVEKKRRDHFHAFMGEVHRLIATARERRQGDPLPEVAAHFSRSARLLCFDELHVTDIADAMILGRLFQHLFAQEVVLVATSNVPPQGLYRDGLNRPLFEPFIAEIEARCETVNLDASKDFRLEKLVGETIYFTPADAAARERMDRLWGMLSDGEPARPASLDLGGRTLEVPRAYGKLARFSFADLCTRALGANDYLRIAQAYNTVFIDDVPRLSKERRNEARRFINLIDTLYDTRTNVIMSAQTEPDGIYPAGDEAFLFERTASRLIEMRSQAYLAERLDFGGSADANAAEVSAQTRAETRVDD